jgi:hypothetical protein
MDMRGWCSLAILFALVGPSRADGPITVYRCEGGDGRLTLQDEPCPAGQAQTTRSMVRPQDPPADRTPAPDAADRTRDDTAGGSFDEAIDDAFGGLPPPAAWPPPPMFQCTDYDGEVRYSEEYAPNDRCVPLSVLGYRVQDYSAAAATCRWVRESCLRLDDASACDRFRDKLRQARSDALHAFSDTAAFRKSEAERLARIVDESCR